MRRGTPLLATTLAILLSASTGGAAPESASSSDGREVQIHLLVMDPGEHLYTRGGHAALMVLELKDGEPVNSTVYNYGDTNWDDPLLVPKFIRGNLTFFLSDTGSLVPTLEEYGVRQGRPVTRQRLFLTKAQAEETARLLKEGTEPGKREYTFHHTHALCSTRIVDLLDKVMDGRLHAEFAGVSGPHTGRHYQQMVFSASPLASMAGDLFLGRLHDRVLDKYESLASPQNMREYFHSMTVPSPRGDGQMVPFAEAAVPLVEVPEPLVAKKSQFTLVLWSALSAFLVAFGAKNVFQMRTAWARRKKQAAASSALQLVFGSSLFTALCGSVMLGLALFSRVPEFQQNELLFLFWPTDFWLAWKVRAAKKERAGLGKWAERYVTVRALLAVAFVFLHVVNVLYQEPRVLVVLGCAHVAMITALVFAVGKVFESSRANEHRPVAALPTAESGAVSGATLPLVNSERSSINREK